MRDLGLTNAEIQTYTTLLRLGTSLAGPIIEKTGLQTSVVHRALNSLIEKGIINYIFEGKHKVYSATEPKHFLEFIEEKKQRFEAIIPELEKMMLPKKQTGASMFRGIKGIKEVYSIMINTSGDEYNTFGGGPPCAEVMGLHWWLNMHEKRIKNGLKSRQVFDLSVKKSGGDTISKRRLTAVRYVDAEFAQFQETVIVGDKVAINVFTENPYSFLIEDKEVAKGYRKYFELLWKSAK